MGHRWQRDYTRAARPPPDIFQGAKDTLTAWVLLLFFCIVLGLICIVFGIGED